jgi:hypothetical protein
LQSFQQLAEQRAAGIALANRLSNATLFPARVMYVELDRLLRNRTRLQRLL